MVPAGQLRLAEQGGEERRGEVAGAQAGNAAEVVDELEGRRTWGEGALAVAEEDGVEVLHDGDAGLSGAPVVHALGRDAGADAAEDAGDDAVVPGLELGDEPPAFERGGAVRGHADIAEYLVDEYAVGVVDATALRGLQALKHVGREVPRDRGVFARVLVHRALGLEGHGEPGVAVEVLGDEGLAVRRDERQAG